jgi:hypothetical protein
MAAQSIGHFARIATGTEIEFLQTFYANIAFKLLSNMKCDNHRFSGAVILLQLGEARH